MKHSIKDLFGFLNYDLQEIAEISQMFDQGDYKKTRLISTEIRKILHDTVSSKSLLMMICNQLGEEKDKILFLSSKSEPIEGEAVLFGNEIIMMHPAGGFIPNMNICDKRFINFSEWWNEEVISADTGDIFNKEWINRKDLICLHANKEGGAHYEPSVHNQINKFGLEETTGFTSGAMSGVLPNKKQAAIRQIAYEVIISLATKYEKELGIKFEY